ncbi:hypothetical protein R2R35_19095 [Anaerocolumna sp. AGMB13020]|uniref:hypothetical protein n=1 Tax=Anaerocolumna sp. AGMB13020 TaxID=3081750 RepID=UPI002953B7D5|nr:hypothetical protein [Anaerocolumna sp. AGMB13020]WOO35883.1 hypothetical protein R2R35_19095 [Anaerocolumna sp. AGMB13020]
MKPFFIVILAVVVIIACLVGTNMIAENNKTKNREKELKEYNETLELVKDINQNSDFGGLELLAFPSKTGKEQSEGASDILPDFAEAAKDGVEGIYFSYPYDSNDYRLAKISLTAIPYHVYGITIGQTLNDVTPLLEEKGFTDPEQTSETDADFFLYRQHHVSISLKISKDTGTIRTIIVSVYDKLDNKVY